MGKRIRRLVKAIRRLARVGRPRTGRQMFQISVSLTAEQIEWLRQFENSSEMLRKLIDKIRLLQGEIEPQLALLAMMREIEILTEQIKEAEIKKQEFHWENFDRRSITDEDGEWQRDEYVPVIGKHYVEWKEENVFSREANPEEAAFLQKKLKAYSHAIESLNAKLKELKERFMAINLTNN